MSELKSIERIEKIEKAVGQLQNIQQQSIAKREVLVEQLTTTNEELKKYNISPKEIDKAIEEKTNEINIMLKEIENLIPWELVDIKNDNSNVNEPSGDMPF